jgi:putative ABC transport system substrate-binding protein
MRRRLFIAILGSVPLGVYRIAHGQPLKKTPRLGVLWHAASAEEEATYLGALRQGLNDLGYVEGRTIVLENRFPAEQPALFRSMAAELASSGVDVLVAVTRPAALAAKSATTTIPIVFIVVPDPVGSGLVNSLARPGGNITGLTNMALELNAKRLGYLKEAMPALARVALLVNGNDPGGARRYIDETQIAATTLGVTLQPVEARSLEDLERAFDAMVRARIQAAIVPADGLFFQGRGVIARAALARRLPTIVYSRETLEAGALMSYGPSHLAIFRRAGILLDKLLKGTRPSELPVEQPTVFEFLINLKTTKALALTMPQSLLLRADGVIE